MLFQPRDKQNLMMKLKNFLWPKKGLQRAWLYIWHRLTRLSATPHVIAIGFAVGAFTSFTPFLGFHFIIAAILALIFGGNVIASAFGTSVGNPLTFPFIWLSTYELGQWFLGRASQDQPIYKMPEGMMGMLWHDPATFFDILWNKVFPVFLPMALGGLPLGIAIGVVCYFIVKPLVRHYQNSRRKKLSRYSNTKSAKPIS